MGDNAFKIFMQIAMQELVNDEVGQAVIDAAEAAMIKAELTLTGDPVGTIRINDDTGAVAHRTLRADGVPIWAVSSPDTSDSYNDLQPTLPWRLLFEPPVPVEDE